MSTCFVPVLPVTVTTIPNCLFGYDQQTATPYIFKTTLDEYGKMDWGSFGLIEGMVFGYDAKIIVHPFSLYPSAEAAWFVLEHAILRHAA